MNLLAELASFARTRRPAGDGLVLRGALAGWPAEITLRQRVRPIPHLRDVLGALTDAAPGALERFVTLEGEYAGLRSARTASGGCVVAAVVLGDTDALLLEGKSDGAAGLPELVRELARLSYLGLGALRRRRYQHAPPPDWLRSDEPYAVRYARAGHTLVVHHARPRTGTEPDLIDRALFDPTQSWILEPPERVHAVRTDHGLPGVVARIVGRTALGGPRLACLRATLSDQRFEHVVELHALADALPGELPAFTRLVASVEPVPAETPSHAAMRYVRWSD